LIRAVVLVVAAAALWASPGGTALADARQAELARAGRTLKIVAFGDSLTSGHRLDRREAYPAVLETMLRKAGLPFEVLNYGVSGDTTARGVRRLDAALAERPHILIVAFGANDGLRGVPVATVRDNLDVIVSTAKSRGVRVLLCGMEALPVRGLQYTLDFHEVIPGVAGRHGVPVVPFLLSGVIGNPELMLPDRMHPNAAGARAMAANVWTYLRPLAEAVAASAGGATSRTSP
jgi:acyl-CoA thioesterase-1